MANSFTRTNFERQIDHAAVIAHGAHPRYRVEQDAEVDASTAEKLAANTKIKQGSVVSLNANGKYDIGLPAGSGVNYPVPHISLKNAFDPDVTTGVVGPIGMTNTVVVSGQTTTYNFSDYRRNTYSSVGGKITALPCTAGYEIETTEFVSGTYAYNDALIAASGDDIGKLTIATAQPFKASGSQPILGFVSRVPYMQEAYLQKRIGFYTNFIPAANA